MKARTTHAVLLSLIVIAGAAATDAHAQSNTDRLQEMHGVMLPRIDSNVDDISDDTSEIKGIVEAVQAAMTGLGNQMSEVLSSVTNMSASVDTVTTEVSAMSSKISSFETVLNSIPSLDARMAGIEVTLGEMETTLSQLSSSMSGLEGAETDGSADTIADLITRIDQMSADISTFDERLADVESSLVSIQDSVDLVADLVITSETGTASSSGGDGSIRAGTAEQTVTTFDYKRTGDSGEKDSLTFYTLDMSFACGKDVAIDSVEMDIAFDHEGPDADEYLFWDADIQRPHDAVNFVMADGRELYHNQFEFTENMYTEVKQNRLDFGHKSVKSDQRLLFATQLYDAAFDPDGVWLDGNPTDETTLFIGNSTRGTEVDLYTVRVNWISSDGNPGCTITFGDRPDGILGVTTQKTLTYDADVEETGKIRKDFVNMVHCSDATEIIGMSTDTFEDERWDDSLNKFAKMYLTVQDGDEEPDTELTFDNNGVVELVPGNSYPAFDGNLEIRGKVPGAENLIVEIDYLTTPSGQCTITR